MLANTWEYFNQLEIREQIRQADVLPRKKTRARPSTPHSTYLELIQKPVKETEYSFNTFIVAHNVHSSAEYSHSQEYPYLFLS